MRRDRKSRAKKEKMIMIASSALVMGALTLTGIYMSGQSDENIDDGYSVDFSQLDEIEQDPVKEIAKNPTVTEKEDDFGAQAGLWADNKGIEEEAGLSEGSFLEDDLDYDPLAAGSDLIQIPGLTDQVTETADTKINEQENIADGNTLEKPGKQGQNVGSEKTGSEKLGYEKTDSEKQGSEKISNEKADTGKKTEQVTVTANLNFTESQQLMRPVSGEVLMPYSMDKSIYFATLDQYKYHPAVVFQATEGEAVSVCADAKVLSVYEHEEIGQAVLLDLGNGYRVTYGQLKDLQVTEGAYVNRGAVLGSVAAPTKYYTLEGCNLYFQLKKEGSAVDPEGLFE